MLRVLLTSLVLIGGLVFGAISTSAAPALAAQTSDAVGVRVVAKPKSIGPGVAMWEFEIVMDTHVKPLNEDLTKSAVLIDENSKRYAATAWDGDAAGGHHRKGALRFANPPLAATSIVLDLGEIGGAARTFRWELK